MTSRLFWKLFLAFAFLNGLASIGLAYLGWGGDDFRLRLGVYPFLVLVALLLVTWWIVSSLVRPVGILTASAKRMTLGDFGDPVYVGTQDELGELASQFNLLRQEMISRSADMERLSTVLAAMNDGVISIDESHQVLFANAAAGRMLDFSPADAHGRSLLESVRSYKLHDVVVRLLASKGQYEMEMEWGEENPRNLLVNATLFSYGTSSAIVIMMIYNLSEQRRLEAMRRDFVANVSHELKTPLSSIKAYAETLSCGGINDLANRDRFLQEIEDQADRLNSLISDLLSLARIEQGDKLLDIGSIPLARVVQLCVRDQERAAKSKRIEVVTEPAANEVFVQADEDGLRQILINLIDNAIKYTPDGGRVTVSWQRDVDRVSMSVADTGIGIPTEMQGRVFERFFRVDKARSREMGGTGLGLAIVKHLCQSFGGTVEVASEPDEGTRFTVFLPRFDPPES